MALALSIVFVSPTYADEPTPEQPINLYLASPRYMYLDVDNYETTIEGGGDIRLGPHFVVVCRIRTTENEGLTDYDDIIEVKVKHLETGRKFSCYPDRCPGITGQSWRVIFMPDLWMFEGTWKFKLIYKGSDGDKYSQTRSHLMGDVALPLPPYNVRMEKSENSILLSWSAIGNPQGSNIDYWVWLSDENRCNKYQLRGNWAGCTGDFCGSYDSYLNKVTFTIPIDPEIYFVIIRNVIETQNEEGKIQYNVARRYIKMQ